MSDRSQNGTRYSNQPRITQLHNMPYHQHEVGEHHGKQEHLTGHEQTRQQHEHVVHSSENMHNSAQSAQPTEEETALLAYQLWQARGCPEGTPDEDWLNAEQQLTERGK